MSRDGSGSLPGATACSSAACPRSWPGATGYWSSTGNNVPRPELAGRPGRRRRRGARHHRPDRPRHQRRLSFRPPTQHRPGPPGRDRRHRHLRRRTPRTDPHYCDYLVEHFTDCTAPSSKIPYDPAIAAGQRLDLFGLRPATREARLTGAAAVIRGRPTGRTSVAAERGASASAVQPPGLAGVRLDLDVADCLARHRPALGAYLLTHHRRPGPPRSMAEQLAASRRRGLRAFPRVREPHRASSVQNAGARAGGPGG